MGHNYTFNICGTSKFRCLPAFDKPSMQFGVAIQVIFQTIISSNLAAFDETWEGESHEWNLAWNGSHG